MSTVRGAIAFCCMLVLSAGLAFAQALLSPQQFRDAAIARLRTTEPTAEITPRDQLGITVDIPGDPDRQDIQINFDNAYAIYREDPSQLDFVLNRWVSLVSADRNEIFQRSRLVAVIRPISQVESYNAYLRQGSGPPLQVISRPFAGDLHEVLVFDSAEAVAYATADKLDELGITVADAWTLSRENIPTRMGDLTVERFDNGILLVGGGNGLAPSSLLMSQFCQGSFARNPVLVVERETFIMADMNVRGAEGAFRGVARDIIAARDSISATILRCQNGRLVAVSD